MVQPFTVMVLADADPGPPVVIELDTEPPPACTCTPVEPAELLLEMLPAPLLLPAEAPAAIEDPVPVGDVDVPPVPTVDAEVPPTAAEPAVPPDMLVWAESGAVASRSAAAAQGIETFMVAFLSW